MPALVNYFSNTRLLWRPRDGAWEVDRLPVESHCHQRCIRHGLDHLRGMCTRKILWQIFHPHLAPRKMNEITFVKQEKKNKSLSTHLLLDTITCLIGILILASLWSNYIVKTEHCRTAIILLET